MSPLPARPRPAPILVLGDLALDVALAPAGLLRRGTDVPGAIRMHQGGSAANTARWIARLGSPAALVCAVGRDGIGRALVAALRADGVTVRAAHPAGARTARIGMLVDASGERSFVADRGAADLLCPGDVRPAWFRGAGVLHMPGYSLLGSPLGEAGRAAIDLARAVGASLSVDLASAAPLLARGRPFAQRLLSEVAPDLLFANEPEAGAFLGDAGPAGLLAFAPVAVVKRGAAGATILARGPGREVLRLDVPTRPLAVADTTGAGDAFDAGFLVTWLRLGRATGVPGLRRAAAAGNRVAGRHLARLRPELSLP